MAGRMLTDPKPFLKWAGGKTQILGEVMSRAPSAFNSYIEPFLGGGAVFFALWRKRNEIPRIVPKSKRKFILADKNEDLVETYKTVRDNLDELLNSLERFQTKVSESEYLKIRKKAKPKRRAEMAARFIYLNKTCYNGLYRVNKNGEFNVPWGGRETTGIYDKDNLVAASRALKDATLLTGDFRDIVERAKAGDFVYTDPPYLREGFSHYTSDGFGRADHERLAHLSRVLVERGCRVLHSNADDPYVVGLYPEPVFQIFRIQSRRLINSDGRGRYPQPELLIRSNDGSILPGSSFEQIHLVGDA